MSLQPIYGTRIIPVRAQTHTEAICRRCGIDFTPRRHPTHCGDCRGYAKVQQ